MDKAVLVLTFDNWRVTSTLISTSSLYSFIALVLVFTKLKRKDLGLYIYLPDVWLFVLSFALRE